MALSVSDSFTSATDGTEFVPAGPFNAALDFGSGTGVGTVQLQAEMNPGSGDFVAVDQWVNTDTDPTPREVRWHDHRCTFKFVCTAYTSGTIAAHARSGGY
jgi:hypothetical protein